MIEKINCQQIGTIVKTHGINGEVIIQLQNGVNAEDITTDFLFLDVDGGLVPYYVEESRTRGDGSLMVIFKGICTEASARKLTEVPVWIDNQEMGADTDQIHSSSLIGFEVVDDVHGNIGKIIDIRDPERNPYFAIEGKAGEILIPVVDEYVEGLDEAGKILYISAPEGLIELYL